MHPASVALRCTQLFKGDLAQWLPTSPCLEPSSGSQVPAHKLQAYIEDFEAATNIICAGLYCVPCDKQGNLDLTCAVFAAGSWLDVDGALVQRQCNDQQVSRKLPWVGAAAVPASGLDSAARWLLCLPLDHCDVLTCGESFLQQDADVLARKRDTVLEGYATLIRRQGLLSAKAWGMFPSPISAHPLIEVSTLCCTVLVFPDVGLAAASRNVVRHQLHLLFLCSWLHFPALTNSKPAY